MTVPVGLVPQDSFRAKLRSALGGYSRVLRLYRRLRPTWLWERFNPMGKATHRYVCENGLRVTRGFAKGVVYPDGAAGHVGFLAAKLSGAYEAELEESLLPVADFDVFVDVGSGDGFYCVAAAKKAPGTTIIGFETDNSERAIAGRLAALNSVKVDFRGTATPAAIESLPPGRLFLLTDIEGYEYTLLDPGQITRLLETTMLIEVHPQTREGLLETLISRFAASHHPTVINGVERQLDAFPELSGWPPDVALHAITEGRPAFGVWLRLDPIERDSTPSSLSSPPPRAND